MMERSFEWQAAAPETQGMSTPRLDALRDLLALRGSKALLVIRHDVRVSISLVGSIVLQLLGIASSACLRLFLRRVHLLRIIHRQRHRNELEVHLSDELRPTEFVCQMMF